MPDAVTLIFTNSHDITVDRLIQHIGSDKIFRFNLDIWEDYQLSITPGDFRIVNPAGMEVRRDRTAKCFWRKPLSKYRLNLDFTVPLPKKYVEAEIACAIREIANILALDGKLVLIEPFGPNRVGKLVQLEVGRKYFQIPDYEFFMAPRKPRPERNDRIVKSLSNEPVSEERYLWTTRVKRDQLEPGFPWLIQDRVVATHDVTVVHVRDEMFGFALDRSLLKEGMDDWRELGHESSPHWKPYALPEDLQQAITGFMEEISLHYGRLDFLFDGETYHFLEVNSNGEWDWLDPNREHGALNKIIEEIHPDTPVYPIPGRTS